MYHPGYAHIKFGQYNEDVLTASSDETTGVRFMPVYAGAWIRGVQFYTHISGAKEYKVSLWAPNNGTAVRTKSETITGPGLNTVLFDTPYIVSSADMAEYDDATATDWFHVGVYETSAGDITYVPTGVVDGEDLLGDNGAASTIGHIWHVGEDHPAYYASGDARPVTASANRHWPISPIVTIDDTSYLYSAAPNTYVYGGDNATVTAVAGDRTCGIRFWLYTTSAVIRGIRFYTAQVGSHTIRCKLWKGGVELASTDVSCSGPGVYVGSFTYSPSAVELGANTYHWYATVWETTGTVYTKSTKGTGLWPEHVMSPGRLVCYTNDTNHLYAAGDAYPILSDGTQGYPIDPIIDNASSSTEPYVINSAYGENNYLVSTDTASRTVGNLFTALHRCEITGARFYTDVSGSHSIKVCLWHPNGTLLRTVTQVCTDAGTYSASFSSSYTVTYPDIIAQGHSPSGFIISMWETTGTYYTKSGQDRTVKKQAQGYCYNFYPSLYALGDAKPSSVDTPIQTYPIDPIVTFAKDATYDESIESPITSSSVTTSLRQATGIHRCLFAMIDGLPDILWQYSSKGVPDYCYRKFWQDDFANSVIGLDVDNPTSGSGTTITESGGKLNFSIPSTVQANWRNSGAAARDDSPIAYETPIPLHGYQRVYRFVTRVSSFTAGAGGGTAEIFLWDGQDPRTEAYRLQVASFDGSAFNIARHIMTGATDDIAYGAAIADPSSVPILLAIEWDSSDDGIVTKYSIDDGATWTTYYSSTCPFTPAAVGVGIANLETVYSAVTASFDYLDVFVQRPTKVCLEPPEELATEINLGEMKPSISGLTFLLNDVADTDGKSYFGKLFASARWDTGRHIRLAPGTDYNQFLDADATTIPVKSTTGFPAAGEAHIGQVTLSYTGVDATNLTGVNMGLYPCVGERPWGQTFQRFQEDEPGYLMHIAQYPYAWIGRRVALYVITYDEIIEDWRPLEEAVLLRVGRVTDEIRQIGPTKNWQVPCRSIMEDLEVKIGNDFPVDHIKGINLMGDLGRSFLLLEYDDDGALAASNDVTIPKGIYTVDSLIAEINEKATSGWVTYGGGSNDILFLVQRKADDENSIVVGWRPKWGAAWDSRTVKLLCCYQFDEYFVPYFCHVFSAFGFEIQNYEMSMSDTGSSSRGGSIVSNTCYEAYHPLGLKYNGARLYCDDVGSFWTKQGDDPAGSVYGYVKIDDVQISHIKQGTICYKYVGTDETNNYLTLGESLPKGEWLGAGYAAKLPGDKEKDVQNVYIPRRIDTNNNRRGPFELLLFPLLSSGTDGYNEKDYTYDSMPLTLSLGIQEELIDVDSFLAADAMLVSNDLAVREFMLIDKPTSWFELIQRECKLFGFVLTWKQGQIKLKQVLLQDPGVYDITIDESTRASSDEFLDSTQKKSTVVNQYNIEAGYDNITGKYKYIYELTDVDSVLGYREPITVEIKHPGIWINDMLAPLKPMLKDLLLGRPLRYASPLVEPSLALTLVNRIAAGDTVRFVSSDVNDPLGTGDRDIAIQATCLKEYWNLRNWAGGCTLMLHGIYAGYGDPWAPAALIDHSYNEGDFVAGYNDTTKQLKLVALKWGETGDPDDGSTFSATDECLIMERSPYLPTVATLCWQVTVDKAYEADGAEILTLDAGTSLPGWDSAKEYIITFADYDSATTGQKAEGTWQADSTTELLDSTDNAQRFG